MPWLFMLGEAGRRRDSAAQREAMHRIATSQRNDLYASPLSALLFEHMPTDDASLLAGMTVAAAEPTGVMHAWQLPGYDTVIRACSRTAVRDANQRQTCHAVAELLVDRADLSLERMIGLRIGDQLGWPSERIDRSRGEMALYWEALNTENLFSTTPTVACDGLRRELEFIRRRARFGEDGDTREWAKHAGKTREDFIRAGQAERTKLAAARAAREVASAASASR